MKKYLTTIITVAVLIVAVVALIIVKNVTDKGKNTDPQPTETEEQFTKVIAGNVSDVKKVETFYNEKYVLEPDENNEWSCTSHAFKTHASSVEGTVDDILSVAGTEIELEDNLADYGFKGDFSANPHVKVTFADGTEKFAYVGDMDYTQNYRYVYPGTGNAVYKVTIYSVNYLMVEKEDLVYLKTFAYSSGDTPVSFMVRMEGEKVLELNYTGSTKDDTGAETWNWGVKYPIDRACENTTANQIIQAMKGITLSGIANENVPEDKLVEYGLAPAGIEYYLYMKSANGENSLYRIKVGNKTPDGSYYYCTIEEPENGVVDIYTISTSYIYRNINPMDYVDTYLYLKDSDLLSSIKFTVSGETHEMRYKYETNKDGETVTTRFFDGRECIDNDDYRIVANDSKLTPPTKEELARNVDNDITNDVVTVNPYDAFNRLLTSLYANMTLSEVVIEEPAAEEKGEQLAEIIYTENDGTVTTVSLYKRDNTTAWAYVNDHYAGGYCRTTALFGDDYVAYDFAISLKGLKTVMAMVP